jgi:L-histidine N-alpha-methyltransferase
MTRLTPQVRPTVEVHFRERDLEDALAHDARVGLTAKEKWLPPVWFYDDRGSRLFDEITRLDEYYPTRAERLLLETHAPEISVTSGADTLVELGAGTCDKSRILLDALRTTGSLERYVPVDVSKGTLRSAAAALADDYPEVAVHAVVADFHRHLDLLPDDGRRMIAFLGGTIGNLDLAERRQFLSGLRGTMHAGDTFLLGTDLVKDRDRLVAAYDDPAGVTAEFNRNVLRVLNRELGATFDPEAFDHVALWDEDAKWIEMRLRSRTEQVVEVRGLGMKVCFAAGEELRTEISAKFTRAGIEAELAESGFAVHAMWEQPGGDFLLTLAHPNR